MTLLDAKTKVSAWLFDQALPLWAAQGVDAQGGFHELLDFEGRPVAGSRRRTRVQARQIYVFCEAVDLGWAPGRAVAQAGLDRMIATCRRDDGLWVAATDEDGGVLDQTADLYDMAFVIFSLAAAHRVLGDPRARPLALETLAAIEARMKTPQGGWLEALPSRLPRRQNPHMHMLEAMLAWQGTDPDPAFAAAAQESLRLCATRFLIDGAIHEYFTEDWSLDPASGHIVEPGHYAEWAWLLRQAQSVGLGSAEPSQRLYRDAVANGLHNGFFIRETDSGGAVIDGGRRLWAQTEGVRTAMMFDTPAAVALIDRIFATHLATDMPGLWIDSYDAEGRSHDAAVPASSLYHLMTAFTELLARKP